MLRCLAPCPPSALMYRAAMALAAVLPLRPEAALLALVAPPGAVARDARDGGAAGEGGRAHPGRCRDRPAAAAAAAGTGRRAANVRRRVVAAMAMGAKEPKK